MPSLFGWSRQWIDDQIHIRTNGSLQVFQLQHIILVIKNQFLSKNWILRLRKLFNYVSLHYSLLQHTPWDGLCGGCGDGIHWLGEGSQWQQHSWSSIQWSTKWQATTLVEWQQWRSSWFWHRFCSASIVPMQAVRRDAQWWLTAICAMGNNENTTFRAPGNAVNAMFDCLADFIEAAGEDNKQFMVFPYNLSHYKQVKDLPALITNVKSLPEEVDKWLQYFLQAKPWAKARNVYTLVLIGLSMPFITFIKKLSPCARRKYSVCGNHPFSQKRQSQCLSELVFIFYKYNGYTSIEGKYLGAYPRTFQQGLWSIWVW